MTTVKLLDETTRPSRGGTHCWPAAAHEAHVLDSMEKESLTSVSTGANE
jgi:hypothetical protein